MIHDNRWTAVDGEGIAWGAGAFAASILAGVIIEPFRRTIGLENVTIIYLLIVVIAAAYGGRAAGVLAALSAALSYDFFLTTPYHQLVIDSLAQVVTVMLLFASGIVASLAGRARRRSTLEGHQQTEAAPAQHHHADGRRRRNRRRRRAAVDGLYDLLDADRVTIKRTGPTGEAVIAEVGSTDQPLDSHDLPHLDQQGRLPGGFGRWRGGQPPPRSRGAVVTLIRGHDQVGELVVVMDQRRLLPGTARLTLATVAHVLAAATPHRSADANRQRPLGGDRR